MNRELIKYYLKAAVILALFGLMAADGIYRGINHLSPADNESQPY